MQVCLPVMHAEAIEAIVERDFFPHLPKLRNQKEWLQAVQSGDPAQIKRAQLNIARRRAGLKTPLPHEGVPLTGAFTPGTGLLRTPAMTPAPGAAGPFMPTATPSRVPAAEAAALEQQGVDPVSAQQQVGAKAPAVGLDQFLSAYDGEDNTSFKELHQKSLELKRAKMQHHLSDKNKPLLLEAGVHATDGYGTSGQTPSSLVMTKHVPKNLLYYDTSQQKSLALTAAEQATIVQGPQKVIDHTATRSLHEQPAAAAAGISGSRASQGTAAVSEQPQQQVNTAAVAVAPGTQGYGYMKTPQIVPGVDASPIMTWGDVASTPLRIDGNEVDFIEDIEGMGHLTDPDNGPVSRQFTMPQVRSRELAAQQMIAGRSAAASRQGHGGRTPLLDASRKGRIVTPARAGVAGSTPVQGGMQLSAAGMKLAQQLKGGNSSSQAGAVGQGRAIRNSRSSAGVGSTDMQLRASYKGGVTPTRPGTWDMTPSRAGPAGAGDSSRQQQRPMSGKISVQQGARIPASASAAAAACSQQQPAANITDDLLLLG